MTNKTAKAEQLIEKARMIVKPINPENYVVGSTKPTGSASIDPRKAGKLNDVRGLIKADEQTAVIANEAVGAVHCCVANGCGKVTKSELSVATPEAAVHQFAVKLQKSDQAEEEHYVLGVVLEPETVDSQGDIYSADEIRKSAHLFMQDFGNIGLQHEGHINDKAKILESYVAPAQFILNDQIIKKGTWMLGARILDDDLWQAIKKGEITGWSIGGSAVRTQVETQ